MRGFHFIGKNIQSTNFDTLIGYSFLKQRVWNKALLIIRMIPIKDKNSHLLISILVIPSFDKMNDKNIRLQYIEHNIIPLLGAYIWRFLIKKKYTLEYIILLMQTKYSIGFVALNIPIIAKNKRRLVEQDIILVFMRLKSFIYLNFCIHKSIYT